MGRGFRNPIRRSSAAIFKIPSPFKPIYGRRAALPHGKGKDGGGDRGKRAIDAYRNKAAAIFLGSDGNGDGTGGTASFRHAAILRYAGIQATPDDPASRRTSCNPLPMDRKCQHSRSIRPEVLKDGKDRLANQAAWPAAWPDAQAHWKL